MADDAFREGSKDKEDAAWFAGTFQKSVCSEMASELRYALDCGNGTKKPAKKTLCRRERQQSNLSIVSEEGKYPACNKYRHFVGKAPLTWRLDHEEEERIELIFESRIRWWTMRKRSMGCNKGRQRGVNRKSSATWKPSTFTGSFIYFSFDNVCTRGTRLAFSSPFFLFSFFLSFFSFSLSLSLFFVFASDANERTNERAWQFFD